MTIRDQRAFIEWLDREHPSAAARQVVAFFLLAIELESWASPGYPIEDLSDRPRHEVRDAHLAVPGEGLYAVRYRHFYDDDTIDLLDITNLRGES